MASGVDREVIIWQSRAKEVLCMSAPLLLRDRGVAAEDILRARDCDFCGCASGTGSNIFAKRGIFHGEL